MTRRSAENDSICDRIGYLGVVRRFFGGVALFAALLASSPCEADGAISVEWVAPEGCPEAPVVSARIDAEIGGARPAEVPLVARATVTRDTAFRLTLDVDGHEPRTIEASSCDELAEATVLVVAMTVESARREAMAPRVVAAGPSAEATPTQREGTAPTVPNEAAPQVDLSPSEVSRDFDAETRKRTWRVAVRVEGELAYGGVPILMAGPRFAVGAEGDAWNAEAALRWLPSVSHDVTQSPRVGASFELVSAVLSGGGAWSWGGLRLELVLAVELGVVTGTAFGLASPGKGSSFWVAVDGGARLRYRWVDRVGVFAALDASVPISRSEWIIDGVGRVADISPIGLSARLGGEFMF